MSTLAPVFFINPDAAACGCGPDRCTGHQPTTLQPPRREAYRDAADVLRLTPVGLAPDLSEILAACAELVEQPEGHPPRDPRLVVRRLLAACDNVAGQINAAGDDTEAQLP